ncbi:MAG: AAA family ATPase [bacterium]
MNKNEFFSILDDWNFWRRGLDTGIVREAYLERFRDLSTSNQIITVTGPRRAGKSYLMRQMYVYMMSQGIKKDNLLFINFEDPRFTSLDTKLMEKIFSTYIEFMARRGEVTLFMDEVQEVVYCSPLTEWSFKL